MHMHMHTSFILHHYFTTISSWPHPIHPIHWVGPTVVCLVQKSGWSPHQADFAISCVMPPIICLYIVAAWCVLKPDLGFRASTSWAQCHMGMSWSCKGAPTRLVKQMWKLKYFQMGKNENFFWLYSLVDSDFLYHALALAYDLKYLLFWL